MRAAVAAFTGLVVFLTVAALTNAALYSPFDLEWPPNITGFWGLVYGSFAGVVAFGIALWVSSRPRSRGSKAARFIAVAALGVFGLGVVAWISMWRVPPFTLEGAWMYPLALTPLIAAAALVRSSRRSREAGDTTEAEPRWSSDLYR